MTSLLTTHRAYNAYKIYEFIDSVYDWLYRCCVAHMCQNGGKTAMICVSTKEVHGGWMLGTGGYYNEEGVKKEGWHQCHSVVVVDA